MTTKAELRDLVRRRLDDAYVSPLWDDQTLDDALTDAMTHYSVIVPLDQRTTVSVANGATAFLVDGMAAGGSVVRIFSPGGAVVPRASANRFDEPGQAWRWWGDQVLLARGAAGGIWAVEWRGRRALPAADGDDVPIHDGDEPAVAYFASSTALRRRAIEEAKRDGRGVDGLMLLAGEWDLRGERLLQHSASRTARSFVAVEA